MLFSDHDVNQLTGGHLQTGVGGKAEVPCSPQHAPSAGIPTLNTLQQQQHKAVLSLCCMADQLTNCTVIKLISKLSTTWIAVPADCLIAVYSVTNVYDCPYWSAVFLLWMWCCPFLGTSDKGTVEVTNCFTVPHNESEDEVSFHCFQELTAYQCALCNCL